MGALGACSLLLMGYLGGPPSTQDAVVSFVVTVPIQYLYSVASE